MAIDAGTVYYTVDADTQKAIDSAAEMNKALDSTKGKMSGLDTQVSKTSKAVNSGLSSVGRSAGQAGIQIQQFIGQIQGGQSAMLALSQQSADLGFVLGAPLLGAVVGIGASLVGMLLPTLFDSSDALEKVEKATERVRAALTLSSDGISDYSDSMKILSQVSEQLARIKLANLIADQANAMKIAAESVGDEITDALSRPFSTYASNVKDIFGTTSAYAYEAASDLRGAANSLSSGITTEGIDKLTNALDKAKDAGINSTEAGRKLVSNMTDLIAQYKLGELTISQLEKQLNSTKINLEAQTKSAKKYSDVSDRLSIRTAKLRSEQLKLEKAITIKKATEEGAEKSVIDSISASYDKIIANEKEKESERALAKAKREKESAEKESTKARNFAKSIIKSGETDAEKASREAKELKIYRDKNLIDEDTYQKALSAIRSRNLKNNKNTNLLGLTDPFEGESQRYNLEISNLKTLNDAKLLEDQRYLDLKAQAETQHEQNMQALREQNFKAQSKNNELLMNSLDALGNAGKNAISGLLSGTMNATQAIQSLANAVLNEAVGALVQMGMQYVKNQIMGDTAAAASVATATATGAAISAAYAPAATAASIATQGGAVGSATAAMSTGVPAMNAMLMGGRLYGGAVQANGMYRINENGAPEVFNAANGQQYMLPNTRGEVVSNKDASGGGGTVIQVNISSDGSVSTDGGSMMAQFGKEIGQFVDAKFKQLQSQSMRQGGALWQYKQNG